MLGMYIGVFEDEEHDKEGFRSLKPSFIPNFGQKPVFRPERRPKIMDNIVDFQFHPNILI